MSTPTFTKTHNLIAFLEKPSESVGFEQIVDFLNANQIKYALTVSPTIYTSCIKQFWTTLKIKTVNDNVRLQALIDEKKVVITEASIRHDLKLNDVEGTSCLPNAMIFVELARMGYEKPSEKLTFYKDFFSPQWKFFIHTILQCLRAKTTSWDEFSSTMASFIICLTNNQKFNFLKYILDNLKKNLEVGVPFYMFPSDDSMPLKELMVLCTNLSNKVLDMENEIIEMKSFHKAKIAELEGRVEKLKEANSIAGGELNAADEEPVSAAPTNITTTQPSEATMTTVDITTALKAKGIVFHDVEESTTRTASSKAQVKDKGKAKLVEEPEVLKLRKDQLTIDEEVIRRIEAEWNADMQENIDWNEVVKQVQSRQFDVVRKYQARKRRPVLVAQERKNMMIYLRNMAGFKIEFFKGISYEEIRPLFEKEYKKVQTLFKEGLEMDTERIKAPRKITRKENVEKDQTAKKQKGDELEKENTEKQKLEE
nr:hypothetical protein [Tanacetum cinerariifolium]